MSGLPAARLGLLAAGLLAGAGVICAQTAGAPAIVSGDKLPVYAKMNTEQPPVLMLERGTRLIIGLVLFGDDVTWCAVTRPGETRRIGYVSCESLQPDRGDGSAPPPPPRSEPKPLPVREAPSPPVQVREVKPAQPPAAAPTTPVRETSQPAAEIPKPQPPEPVVTKVEPRVEPKTEPPPQAPAPAPAAELPKASAPEPKPAAVPTVSEPKPAAVPVAAVLEPKREILPPPAPEPPKTVAPEPKPEAPPRVEEPKLAPVTPAPAPEVKRQPPAPAPPVLLNADEASTQVLDRAGLRSQLAQYVRGTNLLAFLDKSRLEEFETGRLAQVIGRHFQAAALSTGIKTQVRKSYDTERALALSAWLSSAGTDQSGELIRQASSAGARDELVQFAQSLRKDPPSDERLELVHRLFNATRLCDMEVDATFVLVKALAEALNPALPPEKQFASADLDKALGQVKTTYSSVMKNARIVHLLFTFRSSSDAALREQVEFWETPGGVWLATEIERGFQAATVSIAKNLGADIDRRLRASK